METKNTMLEATSLTCTCTCSCSDTPVGTRMVCEHTRCSAALHQHAELYAQQQGSLTMVQRGVHDLNPEATACIWGAGTKGYAELAQPPDQREGRTVGGECRLPGPAAPSLAWSLFILNRLENQVVVPPAPTCGTCHRPGVRQLTALHALQASALCKGCGVRRSCAEMHTWLACCSLSH